MPGEDGWKTLRAFCNHQRSTLEWAIQDASVETSRTIFYKSIQILAYADDINMIGLRLFYVAEAYQKNEEAAWNLGMQINKAKTKLIKSAALPIIAPIIIIIIPIG